VNKADRNLGEVIFYGPLVPIDGINFANDREDAGTAHPGPQSHRDNIYAAARAEWDKDRSRSWTELYDRALTNAPRETTVCNQSNQTIMPTKPISKPWTLIRDRTLAIQASTKLPYEKCWAMAERENPDAVAAGVASPVYQAEVANSRANADIRQRAARKIEARTEFHRRVHAYMAKSGTDYDKALRICRRDHAELCNEMDQPLVSPGQAAALGLSTCEDQDECGAALAGNGNQLAKVDHAKVLAAVADYHAKKSGLTAKDALEKARVRHPNLAALAAMK
jgi:hypothetical protein